MLGCEQRLIVLLLYPSPPRKRGPSEKFWVPASAGTTTSLVFPAQAGIQKEEYWVPAFAGTTTSLVFPAQAGPGVRQDDGTTLRATTSPGSPLPRG